MSDFIYKDREKILLQEKGGGKKQSQAIHKHNY